MGSGWELEAGRDVMLDLFGTDNPILLICAEDKQADLSINNAQCIKIKTAIMMIKNCKISVRNNKT